MNKMTLEGPVKPHLLIDPEASPRASASATRHPSIDTLDAPLSPVSPLAEDRSCCSALTRLASRVANFFISCWNAIVEFFARCFRSAPPHLEAALQAEPAGRQAAPPAVEAEAEVVEETILVAEPPLITPPTAEERQKIQGFIRAWEKEAFPAEMPFAERGKGLKKLTCEAWKKAFDELPLCAKIKAESVFFPARRFEINNTYARIPKRVQYGIALTMTSKKEVCTTILTANPGDPVIMQGLRDLLAMQQKESAT